MASKEQVFAVLAGASGAMSRAELEEGVGESYRKFQTQLGRWVESGLIEDKGDHHYILTDKGREDILAGEFQAAEVAGIAASPEHTEESLGATEYQQFLTLGKSTGVVNLPLIKQTADHIWNGGDYNDLEWVAKGLQEMGIRQDLRSRWWHSWRSFLNQPMPTVLPQQISTSGKPDGKGGEQREGSGKRDYILDDDFKPQFVGTGLGSLDYQDAVDISKIRQAKGNSSGGASTAGTMADEITKVFAAFKTMTGDKTEGRSYVIKPGEGGYEVSEYDPSKPMIIPQPQGPAPATSWFVDGEGTVQQLEAGKPVVIIKDSAKPAAASGPVKLIDRRTGEIEEVAPGAPVIIMREATPAPSLGTPIQVNDKDGNPMTLDISTYIRLEEHRDSQRRAEESHQTKMEIGKGFKDLVKTAQKALSNINEDKE